MAAKKKQSYGWIGVVIVAIGIIMTIIGVSVYSYKHSARYKPGDYVHCEYKNESANLFLIGEGEKRIMGKSQDGDTWWITKGSCEKIEMPPKLHWAISGAVEKLIDNGWSE